MQKIRYLFLLCVTLALVSCAATGPIFSEVENTNAGLATIYLYHPKDDQYGSSEADFLFYNDQQVFRFTHGGYTYFLVDPGDHTFEIRLSTFFVATKLTKGTVTIHAEAGKNYYVKYREELDRVEMWSTGTMAGASRITKANIVQMKESAGKVEITAMKYLSNEF